MKTRLLSIAGLLSAMVLFSNIQLIAQSPKKVVKKTTQIELIPSQKGLATVEFKVNDFTSKSVVANGTSSKTIQLELGTPIQESGAPDLHKLTSALMIPSTGKMELEVISSTYEEYQNIEIAPSKGSLHRNISPSSIPFSYGSSYQQNAFYPGKLAELGNPYIVRDHRGQNIIAYPIQYNPITKVLRIYTELTVQVKNTGGKGVNEIATSASKNIQSEYNSIYNRKFINYAHQTQKMPYTPVDEDGRMLIICHDPLVTAMQPFVDWKQQKGIPVEIVSTSVTGTDENSIFNYVSNYYTSNNDLVFLLLVGDHAQVNTCNMGQGMGETKWSDTKYGFLSGNDHYPEIFVGRFSADNTNDLNTMINRVLEYEKNPVVGDWCKKAVGIASDEGPGDDNEMDWQHMRNIRTDLMNYNYSEVFEFYDGSQGGADASGNPSSNDVANAVNGGISLFNYCGHGDQFSCVTSNYNSSKVNSATNNGMYPFVVSVACNNGTFTSGDCLGETWLKASNTSGPTGAIACCASTILMAWSEPMCAQDEIADILVESYSTNIKRTLGGLFYNGEMKMLDDYPGGGSSGEEVMETWLLFGDPSTMIRTDVPATITASHTSTVNMSATSMDVTCNVEGALICISQNNVILGTGIVSGGSATVTYTSPSTQDDLLVTATAYNGIPYQGAVDISTCAGPTATYSFSLNNLVANFTDASTGTGGTLSYSWDFGDGAGTSTDQNPTYTYAASGLYNVCLTATDSCGSNEKCHGITINNTVGIDRIEGVLSLSVLPNPLTGAGNINFETTEDNFVQLSVYNMLGKEVVVLLNSKKQSGKHSIELNAEDLNKGIYFVRMTAGSKVLTQKLIVH